MTTAEDILAFWFPPGLDADQVTHRRQFEWWFRGGADQAIVGRYQPVLAAASRGELDAWADEPRAAGADHRARSVLAHGLPGQRAGVRAGR